jgi:predicted amidohydrolase
MVLLDQALQRGPDLICLPEGFPHAGVRKPLQEVAEPLTGATVETCAHRAREARCYIVCPLYTREGDHIFNSAVILDRSGEIAGVYHKVCPVTSSPDYTVLESGMTPGHALPVFDLDFGRIGIQICYDVGFPENWQALAEKGARLVLWPSAYDGGFSLRVYAYTHHFYVVSAACTGCSRILDPCGEILQETTVAAPIIFREINLDYVVAHSDWNMGIPDRIRTKYGDRVEIRQWDPGCAHFIVEPKDHAITSAHLQEEFGFESTAEYHNHHRIAYRQIHQGKPPLAQHARHGDRPQYSK